MKKSEQALLVHLFHRSECEVQKVIPKLPFTGHDTEQQHYVSFSYFLLRNIARVCERVDREGGCRKGAEKGQGMSTPPTS